jgi:hypothetical protein
MKRVASDPEQLTRVEEQGARSGEQELSTRLRSLADHAPPDVDPTSPAFAESSKEQGIK